jgi:hypothetical protein
LDMTIKHEKPSVAVLVNQIRGGVENVMEMMKVATALLREKASQLMRTVTRCFRSFQVSLFSVTHQTQ